MYSLKTAGLVLIALNVLLTWYAFQNRSRFEQGLLRIGDLRNGQFYRLFSSGFLHVDWTHLFFNMFSLYIFAGQIEERLGDGLFILVYIVSLVGGNLLAWFFHRSNPDYRAVGASGAVSGIIFSYIVLFPQAELSLIFLPFFFPAWIYGLLFILYSIYGMGRQNDNIGHEAHLGGALSGLFITMAIEPYAAQQHPMTIIYLVVPSVVFLVILFFRPRLLAWNFGDGSQNRTIDDQYQEEQFKKEKELNRILEKVKHSGADSLSKEERQFLEENY